MLLRCAVTLSLIFFAAQAALVKKRNIPVEIVYDKSNPAQYASRNLDAKIQLSPDDLLKLKLSDEIINEGPEAIGAQVEEDVPHGNFYGVRNLDEKVQLSQEELGQALKFLPNTIEQDEPEKSVDTQTEENVTEAQPEKPENNNLLSLLQRAQEIVYSGINSIKNNIDKATDAVANAKPSPEAWEKLNQTLDQFFTDQYKSVSVKDDAENNNQNQNQNQNNQNNEFIAFIISSIQNIAGNFGQNNFGQNGQKPEDEQQQGQNPWTSIFTGGWNQVFNNIINMGQNQNNTSGQEDTGTGGGGGGFGNFPNIQNWFQQFFSGTNQGNNPSQSVNGNQSDTGVQQPSNQGGIFQGPINQFNQFVNQFRPSSSTEKPAQGGAGDSGGSGPSIPGSEIFGQVIPGQGGAGGGGGSGPSIPGSEIFGQVIPGQGGSGGSGSAGGNNPFVSGAQVIGSQIGQLGSNFGSGSGSGSSPSSSTEKSRLDSTQESSSPGSTPLAESNKQGTNEEEKASEVMKIVE